MYADCGRLVLAVSGFPRCFLVANPDFERAFGMAPRIKSRPTTGRCQRTSTRTRSPERRVFTLCFVVALIATVPPRARTGVLVTHDVEVTTSRTSCRRCTPATLVKRWLEKLPRVLGAQLRRARCDRGARVRSRCKCLRAAHPARHGRVATVRTTPTVTPSHSYADFHRTRPCSVTTCRCRGSPAHPTSERESCARSCFWAGCERCGHVRGGFGSRTPLFSQPPRCSRLPLCLLMTNWNRSLVGAARGHAHRAPGIASLLLLAARPRGDRR